MSNWKEFLWGDDGWEWIASSDDAVIPILLSVLLIFFVLGLSTRVARLRSRSQMTGFDFGVNVAIGSIIATTLITDASVLSASLAIASLYLMMLAYSKIRRHLPVLRDPTSQNPHLLWTNGDFLEDNMAATTFNEGDVYFAMRQVGVRNTSEVDFVIAETTGELSVFTTSETEPQAEIFEGVVGAEKLGVPSE